MNMDWYWMNETDCKSRLYPGIERSGRRGKRSQHDDQWEQYESVFDPSKRLYFDEEARRRIESWGYGVFSEKR